MSRPKLPDEQLKHKRRVRDSPVSASQLDIKEPSATEKAKWKPLIDACTRLIILNNRVDNVAKKAKIRLWLPSRWSITSNLPPCRCEGANKLMTINAELPLLWLYIHRLAKYSPTMLYKGRQKYSSGLTALVNETLDLEKEFLYDGCFEIDELTEET